jgi:DNA-binding transcriptional regulator LsrR (DeoR family)
VNRLLAEARSSGLVSIAINSRLSSCLVLEDALRRTTGLRDAVVVPSPAETELLPALLGRAAGEYVSRHLESHSV